MKDIIISTKRQKTEVILFCVCLLLAVLLNMYAIIAYNTEWSELWTQLLWVLVIGCILYGLTIVVRLIVYSIRYWIFSKKKDK